jgi:hypothetical protein
MNIFITLLENVNKPCTSAGSLSLTSLKHRCLFCRSFVNLIYLLPDSVLCRAYFLFSIYFDDCGGWGCLFIWLLWRSIWSGTDVPGFSVHHNKSTQRCVICGVHRDLLAKTDSRVKTLLSLCNFGLSFAAAVPDTKVGAICTSTDQATKCGVATVTHLTCSNTGFCECASGYSGAAGGDCSTYTTYDVNVTIQISVRFGLLMSRFKAEQLALGLWVVT